MIKKYVNTYKYNSVFIRTLVILILFSIIPPLIVNIVLYNQSTDSIKQQAIKTNMNMLTKTSQMVDLVFKQIKQTIPQLGMDDLVQNAVLNPDMNYISRNIKIIDDLKKIISTNNYILSIYIYSSLDRTIITSDGGIHKLDDFYDKEWINEYETFFQGIKQLDTRKISDAHGNQFNSITLIGNLPYLSWSKVGAVVININEDVLYSTITGEDVQNEGEFFVISDRGYVLSHKDKSRLYNNISSSDYMSDIILNQNGTVIKKIDGKQHLLTYVTSPYNYWKYIYTMPLEDIEINYKFVSRVTIMMTAAYILISLILSFLISSGIYQPIEKLMNQILGTSRNLLNENKSAVKNEYDFIGLAYNDIVVENRNMQDIINSVRPMVKEKLFTNIILGKNTSAHEVEERLDFIGVNLGASNFIVIVMQIDGYNDFLLNYSEIDRNLYKLKLTSIVENIVRSRHKGVCIELESDKSAAIVNFRDDVTLFNAKEESLDIASQIKQQVEDVLPFTITIGIGRMYKDMQDVKQSYKEAVDALKYKVYQGKNIIIDIEDIGLQSEELYYYYSEKEKLLINNIKVGQQENVKALIEELFNEILANRNISYPYVQQVFIRIVNSIMELIINMGATVESMLGSQRNLYEELSQKETINEIKVWLSGICFAIIENINSINLSRSGKYVELILQYIDENMHRDISLSDVAECINLTPAYVSKIFKENIGKNYVDYLHESRISKSKQLLSSTMLSIKEVGFRVGFSSLQTFFRTFKKYEGITPGQYREKLK